MDPVSLWVFYPRILRFLRKRVRADDAEDLTAAVFEKVCRHARRFRSPNRKERMDAAFCWLMRITRNALIDYYRRAEPVTIEYSDEVMARYAPPPEEELFRRELTANLAVGMRSLNREQGRLVASRYVAGLNIRQTALLMGISEGAVRSMQWRALENMRHRLEAGDGSIQAL